MNLQESVLILTTLSIFVFASTKSESYCSAGNDKNTIKGKDGCDGVPGRDGVKGERGDKGEKGETGPVGQAGPKGQPGTRGQPGPEGRPGPEGQTGPIGQTGPEGQTGPKGPTGPVGQPGPKSGGVVYTRWGRKSCPTGAELLYEGITGGSHYTHTGGGANYVCLPKVPQYMSTNVPTLWSHILGTEYEVVNNIFPGKHDHNVPCAVCYATNRITKLMIPAWIECPDSSWTMEYKGYLMADRHDFPRNAYECVDEDPESVDGSEGNTDGALFYFTRSTCNGLPCPPYVNNRAITCVVCTK